MHFLPCFPTCAHTVPHTHPAACLWRLTILARSHTSLFAAKCWVLRHDRLRPAGRMDSSLPYRMHEHRGSFRAKSAKHPPRQQLCRVWKNSGRDHIGKRRTACNIKFPRWAVPCAVLHLLDRPKDPKDSANRHTSLITFWWTNKSVTVSSPYYAEFGTCSAYRGRRYGRCRKRSLGIVLLNWTTCRWGSLGDGAQFPLRHEPYFGRLSKHLVLTTILF